MFLNVKVLSFFNSSSPRKTLLVKGKVDNVVFIYYFIVIIIVKLTSS